MVPGAAPEILIARHRKERSATANVDPSLEKRVGPWRRAIGVAPGWMAGTPVVAVVRAVSLHHDGCAMSRPRPAALRTSLVTRKFTRSAIDNAIPRLKLTAEVKPMLIGRDAEAAKITSFLDELAGGSRVLLIEGGAGIGKTTLLREGRAVATQLGMTVLSAFPVESEIPWSSRD